MNWAHVISPHTIGVLARAVPAVICLTATGYYLFAVFAAREFFSRVTAADGSLRPPVTILKPICGLDPGAYENFASFCRQAYPRYQVVFGADREDDPGIAIARQIARDFPDVDIRVLVVRARRATNPKVGTLAGMVPEAKYPLLLISDSDICVGPNHLATIVQPMQDPKVGVVTCLYRSHASRIPGLLDALGLSTDFQPSVLVAGKIEGITFAMGSGILIRRAALRAIGGMEAIAHHLADDYLLGNLPLRAGYRTALSPDVVEHTLGTSSFRGLIEHQIRWNRGILASRPGGYVGLVLTQGVPASLLLLLLGGPPWARFLPPVVLVSRLYMAWFVAVRCLRDRGARRALWLVPVRDLLGFVLWLAAYFGNTVVWRGKRFRLEKGGKLTAESSRETAQEPAIAETEAAS